MAILGRARRIIAQVRPAIEAVFSAHGVDTGEFDVLATLLRSGPPYRLRPTELYKTLMISFGGLSDRLARLAKAGLVSRHAAQDDARSLLVQLTERGGRTIEKAFREDMALEADLLRPLSEQERRSLACLLRKLACSLDR